MAHENKILHISLFVGLVGMLASGVAYGAVRIGNKTKNDTYRQMVAANAATYNNQNTVVVSTESELPIRVADADLAKQITNGTAHIGSGQVEACSRIYPDGEFAWDKPTAGVGAGGASTCVAVVELRTLTPSSVSITNPNAPQYIVLARANVAAGSNVKCNISEFPEASYTLDAANVLFPADAEPTTEDVIKVMNQEQKQNAGLKIAAATLVGAIGGNIAGKNDVGKDGLIGTDKGKIQGTLIGALGGAAIGTGGAFAGKVGGDMIMSTGVNAAAGGVVGNIMASGDSVLRIENCQMSNGAGSAKCLWGYVVEGTNIEADETVYFDLTDKRSTVSCKDGVCKPDNFVSVMINLNGKNIDVNSAKESELEALSSDSTKTFWLKKESLTGKSYMESGLNRAESHVYVPVVSAVRPKNQIPALIWGVQDKLFGMKRSDWYQWKNQHLADAQVYRRDTHGNASELMKGVSLNNFEPMYVDAEDGGIIDLNNKARLKGTMIGAGVGGAAGAFTAYQGAQSDIDERWVSAVREYKDSLQKFYCATGNRFMSYYNDVVVVPDIRDE